MTSAPKPRIGVLSLACAAGLLALLAAAALAVGSASADSSVPSLNEDGMSFGVIHGPSDPEEYSWRVTLGEDQELRFVNDQLIQVFYSNGFPGFEIPAKPASDAVGSSVPTSLSISGSDVVTLTVHHRAGNPAAGGAPFVYPIVGGTGWEGGFRTEVGTMGGAVVPSPTVENCIVPKLKGLGLKRSAALLKKADCAVGSVTRAHGVKAAGAKVVAQHPVPGKSIPAGSPVGFRLAN